jgi:acyl-CoA thioesterase
MLKQAQLKFTPNNYSGIGPMMGASTLDQLSNIRFGPVYGGQVIASDLSAAGGMADQRNTVQVKLFDEL